MVRMSRERARKRDGCSPMVRAVAICVIALFMIPMMPTPITSPMAAAEPVGPDVQWWDHWTRDGDRDGVDDELQHQMALKAPDEVIRVFVDYDHHPDRKDLGRLISSGASIFYECRYIDTVIVDIRVGLVRELSDLPGVVMLEADPVIERAIDSAGRSVSLDVVMGNWSYTGDGVVIGIVDTGVDVNHTGLDDLDDINETYDPKVIAFYDAKNEPDRIEGDVQAYDDDGHGSHVSGIASGTGAGSQDYMYRGVAPNSKLVGIKVLGPSDNSMSDAMRGLEWARDNKKKYNIRILSLSFGAVFSGGVTNDGDSAVSRLCDSLVEYGYIVIVAAGNSGPRRKTIAPPGDAKQVITVGNVEDSGSLNPSSSRGPVGSWSESYIKPDICAPGTNIYSVAYNTVTNYTEKTGTSMSAPFVAGVVALMLQIDPGLTPAQVKTKLAETAGKEMSNPLQGTPNNDYGHGRIQPYEIVMNMTNGVKPPRVHLDPIDPLVRGVMSLSGTAESDQGSIMWVEIQTGTGEWQQVDGTDVWHYIWDTTGLQNGPMELRLRAYDGNLYSVLLRKVVTVNNIQLSANIPDNAEFSGNSSIKGTARGLVIKAVDASIDGGSWEATQDISPNGDWSSWQFDFAASSLKKGRHTFVVRAYDGYAHTESRSYTIVVAKGDDGGTGFIPGFEVLPLLVAFLFILILGKGPIRGSRRRL